VCYSGKNQREDMRTTNPEDLSWKNLALAAMWFRYKSKKSNHFCQNIYDSM